MKIISCSESESIDTCYDLTVIWNNRWAINTVDLFKSKKSHNKEIFQPHLKGHENGENLLAGIIIVDYRWVLVKKSGCTWWQLNKCVLQSRNPGCICTCGHRFTALLDTATLAITLLCFTLEKETLEDEIRKCTCYSERKEQFGSETVVDARCRVIDSDQLVMCSKTSELSPTKKPVKQNYEQTI